MPIFFIFYCSIEFYQLFLYKYFFRDVDQLLIDDEVLVQGNKDMTPVKVIDVSSITMQGNNCSSIFLYSLTDRSFNSYVTVFFLQNKIVIWASKQSLRCLHR